MSVSPQDYVKICQIRTLLLSATENV